MANVSLQFPRLLQQYCGNRESISVNAKNVKEALQKIQASFPELYVNICNETGEVRQHINLFVNDELVDKNSLTKAILKPGDDLLIFTSVSGG